MKTEFSAPMEGRKTPRDARETNVTTQGYGYDFLRAN